MVNWISVRSILTPIILRELNTKSVDFVLVYAQADVKSEIFLELPIVFGVKVDHPIEWVIRMDKNLYGLNDAGMAWFQKVK